MEKGFLFNKWCKNNWTSICKNKNKNKNYLNLNFNFIQKKKKKNSRWIIDLNVKYKTIKG